MVWGMGVLFSPSSPRSPGGSCSPNFVLQVMVGGRGSHVSAQLLVLFVYEQDENNDQENDNATER